MTLKIKNGEAEIRNEQNGEVQKEKTSDPLGILEEMLNPMLSNNEFRFIGGAVGYISYDTVRYWETLPKKTRDDLNFPDIHLGVFDDGIVFDHQQRRVFYYFSGDNRLSEIEKLLTQSPSDREALVCSNPKVNVTQADFEKAVEKAKGYVTSGDAFQIVLSKRYEFQIEGDLITFYHSLREINPSPYMYFFKAGDRQIVGSSPEMLVRVDNRVVETFPIAGTRPSVEKPSENKRLAKELLADPKERAEHVMLVDLARNDVGKIAKFGTVHVPEFMKVHRYSHVQHIVSQVVGKLKDNLKSYDALRAVFPAGTVSGAPKIRAMELIDELEPTQRGPYAGAVGYFSYNGNADFAITIRTLFAYKDKAYIQVGAGVVADSIPEREWAETNHKAGALIKALIKAEGETT